MINLATQRLVFVAAKSNSFLPAVFQCALCYLCWNRKEGRQCLGIGAANAVRPRKTQGTHKTPGQLWITSQGRCVTTGSI